jgi:hypothetical protein
MGNSSRFADESSKWTATNIIGHSNTYQCNSVDILGPYNQSIVGTSVSKTYTNVPSHTMIIYRMVLYQMDGWNGEKLQLTFGSKTVDLFPFISETFTENICAAAITLRYVIYGQVFHTGTTLVLSIKSDMATPTVPIGWGVREVGFLFTNKTATDTELVCADAPISFPVMCACRDGQYRDSNGLCQQCHFACASCTGPTVQECFSCKDKYPLIEGKCGYDKCPPGMTTPPGLNMNDRQCINCITGCNKCDKNYLECEWCKNKYYYYNSTLSCIKECPVGFWPSNSERLCKPCAKGCKACSGYECFSCEGDRVYPYGKLCFTYKESQEKFVKGYSVFLLIMLGYRQFFPFNF